MTRPVTLLSASLALAVATARGQFAPEVDDCTVFYREDYAAVAQADLSQWGLDFSDDAIAELERRYARRPNNRTLANELAAAYAFAGRYDEAERLIAALTAHRRATRADLAVLLEHYALRGAFADAEKTIERFRRRFGDKRQGVAWTKALELYAILSAEFARAEDILAFPLPATTRVAMAAEFAFANGDVAGGLLLTEALYYVGGFPAVPRRLVNATGVVQSELLRSVAHGEGWPYESYAEGQPRAAFAEALTAGIADAIERIGEYPSMLEFYADVRLHAQEGYRSLSPAGDDLVSRIMAFAQPVHEAGRLRWISLARLREIDRDYFDALTCSEADEWSATQQYVGEELAATRTELSDSLGPPRVR